MIATESDLHFFLYGALPAFSDRWDGDFNDFCALHLTIGRLDLWYGEERHLLEGAWWWGGYPGPKVQFSGWEYGEALVHRYITFDGPISARWAAEGLLFKAPQLAEDVEESCNLFDKLLGLAARTDRWGKPRAVNALEDILLRLAEARTQSIERPTWVSQVLADLETGPYAPDYAALASRYNMSLTTMRERFRSVTGNTLHGYLLQLRLSRARTMLAETDMPMKRIADELGYSDIYYFSRQFHQIVGISPSAFRRSRQR
jgi:AraC-like DNA-binding protein